VCLYDGIRIFPAIETWAESAGGATRIEDIPILLFARRNCILNDLQGSSIQTSRPQAGMTIRGAVRGTGPRIVVDASRTDRIRPRLALRQAPLSRRDRPSPPQPPDAKAVENVAKTLSSVEDEELRAALARLGASIKRN